MPLNELAERVDRLAARVDAIETFLNPACPHAKAGQPAARPWKLDEAPLQDLVDALFTAAKADPLAALSFEQPDTADYLAAHARNVARLAMLIAREYGFSEASVRTIGLCGLLHDAGMESLPPAMLEAGRPLTPEEFGQVRRHPLHGADYIRENYCFGGLLDSVIPMAVEQHHERSDGSGYPNGLAAGGIHDFARVLSVADSFEAMTVPRAFRRPQHPAHAMRSLLLQGYRGAGEGMYDRRVLRAFVWAASLYPLGCEVGLSDGRRARVAAATGDPKRPMVKTEGTDGEILDLTEHAAIAILN